MKHLVILALVLTLLTACGGEPTPTPDLVATQIAVEDAAHATMTARVPTATLEPPATNTPEPTDQPIAEPTATSAPTDTLTPTPTSTLTPTPTATSQPTWTPKPTDTPTPSKPAFQRWTSVEIVTAFSDAGLEVGAYRPMTRDDYGFAPLLAVEGTRFLIPSLGEDSGGRILSFTSEEDLETTKSYYVELGKASAAFFSWVFEKDNILVQINGQLAEEKAQQYEAVLKEIGE